MPFEPEQAIFDGGKRGKVVGREDLALDDREVNLDLVELGSQRETPPWGRMRRNRARPAEKTTPHLEGGATCKDR